MIFYILETRPPQLVYTQAEAKQSGKRWEMHEIPTDKEGLLNYVNALLRSDPPPAEEADAPEQEITGNNFPPVSPAQGNLTLSQIDEILLRTSMEILIGDMTDLKAMDKLQDALTDRFNELERQAEEAAAKAAAGPVIRKRTRA